MKIVLVLLVLLLTKSVWSGEIDRGFKSLKKFDYFSAKQSFEKSLKKEPVIANFGLSIIYQRNDNPFHDFDKAYKSLFSADQGFYSLPAKRRSKYQKYGFSRVDLDSMKLLLATDYYRSVILKMPSETSFQRFIILYPWAKEKSNAIHQRDSIAYRNAELQNTSKAFYEFTLKYPDASLFHMAEAKYFKLQYDEQTTENSINSYVEFLKNYPKNPYVDEAQDRIFDLYTKDGKQKSYYRFTQEYPQNRNVEVAWRKVYQIFMFDYSSNRFDEFLKQYPNYPYKNEVNKDKELAFQTFFPCNVGTRMTWMDMDGNILYPAKYESVGMFNEGLSAVQLKGRMGFVDKRDSIVIPIIYSSVNDFNNGRAIVEQNDKYGIIDRTGKLIFDTIYESIGDFSEGIIYAEQNGKYRYYDKYGTLLFNKEFENAFSFSNHLATVDVTDSTKTIINNQGTYLLPPIYNDIRSFYDSTYIVSNGEAYGIVDQKNDTILPLEYDEIGDLSEGLAIVGKDGKMGYINASGKVVIPVKYDTYPNYLKLSQFNNSAAKVFLKGKYGAISTDNKLFIPLKYSQLGKVDAKKIAFSNGGKWGFISNRNAVIIPPKFDFAESYKDGYAVFELLVQQGVMDENQNVVIPNKYSSIQRFENNFWIASDGAKSFLYTLKGKLVSTEHYQRISKIDEHTILLFNPDELQYYLIKEDRLIKQKK